VFQLHSIEQLLKLIAVVCAVCSLVVTTWYLVRRPHLDRTTKVLLLVGLGLLPAVVSLTGNIASFEYTMSRPFCGSCHVMGPYLRDAEDPSSTSLAAAHSRNGKFGEHSCYTCHSDYQMFGAVTTKLAGMRHLFSYVTEYASTGPDGEGGPPIHMYEPFKNDRCMQCHSTLGKRYLDTHGDDVEAIRSGDVRCIDCHDEVHPLALSRRAKKEARR
jgi:cytochrome c-type protein NapC